MKTFMSIVATLAFLAIAGQTPAHAQVVDSIAIDIPFDFTVRDTTLPAGHYTVKRLVSSDPGVMEILGADDPQPLIFIVQSAQVLEGPQKTEFIFERIGERYFLSKVFEEGDSIGVEVPKSRVERTLEKEGGLTQVHSVTIPAGDAVNAKR
jgi:hypothetical protein